MTNSSSPANRASPNRSNEALHTEWELSEEERRLLDDESSLIDEHGPCDPYDSTYWVPHQQDHDRLVRFNVLTVTVDEIMEQCGFAESQREHVTRTHSRIAKRRLEYYKGPVGKSVPLLQSRSQLTST